MYAVLVIAAILLSVGPMHARTILAALPATSPGHQFALDEADRQSTRADIPSATRQSIHPAPAAYAPTSQAVSAALPVAAGAPRIPAPSMAALEHAPNAP